MPKNFSTVVESILSRGIDMEEFGSANWALCPEDALEALSKLHELGIPVLGGDVWEKRDGHPSLTLDNWFSRPKTDEPFAGFLERSIAEARNYIRSYRPSGNVEYLFEIVVDRSAGLS
ncbi:MAG TPA: Imm40 family immunity protein [Rhodopila sp.]|jgi:hypothetical protein